MALDIQDREQVSKQESRIPSASIPQQRESSKVMRNIASALLTQIFSFLLAIATNYFLPHYAGVYGIGKMTMATTIVGMAAVIIPLGTETILIREIARDKAKTAELLLATILLRIPLSLIGLAVTYGAAYFLRYDLVTRQLVLAMGVGTAIGAIGNALAAGLQGQERIVRSNVVKLIQRFSDSVLIIVLVLLKAPLWVIVSSGTCSTIFTLIINLHSFPGLLEQFREILLSRSQIEALWQKMRFLVFGGLPFVGWSIANQLYGCTDPFVLKAISGLESVGWYNVAVRLSGTTLFIPVAIVGSLSPALMRLYREDGEGFERLSRQMFGLCVLTGIPLSLALSFGGEQLFALFRYPTEFVGALPVLQVAGFFTLTICIGMALGAILIASDRQRVMLYSSIVGGIIAIPLCIAGSLATNYLVKNAAIGAMASDAVLEVCLIAIYIRGLPFRLLDSVTLSWLGRCVLASLPMIGILLLTKHSLFGAWGLIPAALMYGIACLLLKCIDQEWIDMVRGLFGRRS